MATVCMESLKLICARRLRSVDKHLGAQAVAIHQTMRETHTMRPHRVCRAIAEVADLLIIKVRYCLVFERHDRLSICYSMRDGEIGARW